VTLSAHPEVLADAVRAAGWPDPVDDTERGV
jgi:hypothetical protein